MATFDFPYHTVSEKNPQMGAMVQFGESYRFNTGPTAPPQRMFTLNMKGMRIYTNPSTGEVDTTTNTKKDNVMVLYQFWKDHYQHVNFVYNHPLHGAMNVRFAAPLDLPPAIEGGSGVLPEFQLQFIEIP